MFPAQTLETVAHSLVTVKLGKARKAARISKRPKFNPIISFLDVLRIILSSGDAFRNIT